MAYPQIIQLALKKLESLVSSHFFRYGRSRGYKAMRCDHMKNHIAVLETMVKACCLQFEGSLCAVSGNTARSLTVPEISQLSKIDQRTVERCLADLEDMKLLKSEKQFKRLFPEGLKVSAVWREFTRLFWEKLDLWSLFVESVKYAQKQAKLFFKRPLKLISVIKRKITSEDRRRSQQNNLLFIAMTGCSHRQRGKPCQGRYQTQEICALCHKFSV